jgi:hypothetical protein
MKKVINGKLYNTETATKIASNCSSGIGMSDFRFFDESLYVTKNKMFFLAGEGHAMTKWASDNGNTRSWGEGIKQMSYEKALKWCEDAEIEPEIIEKYFTITEA